VISAVVSGNLGRDAELRKAGQYDVVSFTVASKGFANGQKTTDWIRIDWFGKRAIGALPHLLKGCGVIVRGVLSIREYESKGTKRTSIDLKADDVEIMMKAPASESGGGASEQNFDGDAPF
jgi:single-stranded DNA-binding protein